MAFVTFCRARPATGLSHFFLSARRQLPQDAPTLRCSCQHLRSLSHRCQRNGMNFACTSPLHQNQLGLLNCGNAVPVRFASIGRKLPEKGSPITWRTLLLSAVLVGVGIYYVRKVKGDLKQEEARKRRQVIGKAKIGGRFDLVNTEGKPVKSEDFQGTWVLLYFGFTHCPDVCPDQLDKLSLAIDLLRKSGRFPDVLPVFISVDPERDTPEKIKAYLSDFHKNFIGLTGTKEQVDQVCKAFRVYYSASPKIEDDYIVDHTIISYLIGPDGQFFDYFGQNRSAEEMAQGMRTHMLTYYMERRGKEWENIKSSSIKTK